MIKAVCLSNAPSAKARQAPAISMRCYGDSIAQVGIRVIVPQR